MDLLNKNIYSIVKRSYKHLTKQYGRTSKYSEYTGDRANELIYECIKSNKPAMIARFGSNELQATINYLNQSNLFQNNKAYRYLHWNDVLTNMHIQAGFFPRDINLLQKFGALMVGDMNQLDILGSWRYEERFVKKYISGVKMVRLRDFEPYYHTNPWSRVLKDKKVLVIHPFEKSIQTQYSKRLNLFNDKNILPEFELSTLKAVQSIAGNLTEYTTWFDALEEMKANISSINFDIALIGCGAYGFPLSAHVKRLNKQAIHLGGALQLLFGIKGKRWENNPGIQNLVNSHWIYPLQEDTPQGIQKVENGCYWK